MFPVTVLKNVEFPLPANALNMAVKMKQSDTQIMPKILTHLCDFPLVTDAIFILTPLSSSILLLRSTFPFFLLTNVFILTEIDGLIIGEYHKRGDVFLRKNSK